MLRPTGDSRIVFSHLFLVRHHDEFVTLFRFDSGSSNWFKRAMAPSNPSKSRGTTRNSSSSSKKRPASNSPRSPKRAATAQAVTSGKAKSSVSQKLSGLGFSATKRPQYQIGTKILLDDSIYNEAVPAAVKGKLFVYEISAIDPNGKTVTIQFKDQVIAKGGDRFQAYKEGDETQVSFPCCCFFICTQHHGLTHPLFVSKFMNLPIQQVKNAHELWFEANTRSNSRKQREKEAAAALEIDDDDDGETDLSDIDKLFNEKGQGPHLLELDFEPETEEPVVYTSSTTGYTTRAWPWRHKLVAGVVARRYPTQSKKGGTLGCFRTSSGVSPQAIVR